MKLFEVDDAMVEAWFSSHQGSSHDLTEDALSRIASWFPVIGVAANDRSARVVYADRSDIEGGRQQPPALRP